jgi:hypothetical protein
MIRELLRLGFTWTDHEAGAICSCELEIGRKILQEFQPKNIFPAIMKIAVSYGAFEVAEVCKPYYWEREHRCFQDYKDDADDLILLHWAVKYRVKQVIQTLLEEGVSFKQRDFEWNTIFNVAASGSHTFFIHV